MTPEIKDAIGQLSTTIILGVLGLITTVVIPYLALLARTWVKAKITKIADEKTRADIEHAFGRLDTIIETVVGDINQTAKRLGADGKLTAEDKAQLKTLALGHVGKQLTPWMRSTLAVALPNIGRYVAQRIEEKVGRAKIEQTTAECK
jgi:hypothetical protein